MTDVLSHIKKNHIFSRTIALIIGCFAMTFVYNAFLVPNNIATGGASGLAIIIKELTGLNTTVFINGANVVLVSLSFMFLGKKKTLEQLLGCIVYLIMLNITEPIARSINMIIPSDMLMIIIVSVVWGISNGLIFRAGFSTGGTDFLSQIFADKFHIPVTRASLVIQVLVLTSSLFVSNISRVMMAIFIIYVSNKITNIVLFGQSTSKLVYVVSKKSEAIEDYIMNDIKTGSTEIKVHGGKLGRNQQMLMCVVHNYQYEKFKNIVHSFDPDAFMMSNSCYEVSGGIKYKFLPF